MLNDTETVEAEAERLLIVAQQPRRRGRPQRGQSQLLQRALALCEPYVPARLFDLLCALTHERPPNLDEPRRTKKQGEIFELDLKSNARLSLGQIARRVRVSRQCVRQRRVKDFPCRISETVTRRLDAKDPRPPKEEPPPDVSYLIREIERRGGTFPVKSPINGKLYPDADAYARHLSDQKVTFSFPENQLVLQPACWSEPTVPDVARYSRIFSGKPPIIQPRFCKDEAGERVAIIIPGDVVSILVKNVDDSSRERWPREYAEFKAEPARRPLHEGSPVHARGMVEEIMATGIL